MPHPKDEPLIKTLPNGWVALEPGDFIPRERMYCERGLHSSLGWRLSMEKQDDRPYDPDRHRALARRATPSEREW